MLYLLFFLFHDGHVLTVMIRNASPFAAIDFGLLDPLVQRLSCAPDLREN